VLWIYFFNFIKKNIFVLDGCNKKLTKSILTKVFEKNVPLSLCNAKLYKEKELNFSFVGGLKEAKQTLIESIIWPSVVSLNCVCHLI